MSHIFHAHRGKATLLVIGSWKFCAGGWQLCCGSKPSILCSHAHIWTSRVPSLDGRSVLEIEAKRVPTVSSSCTELMLTLITLGPHCGGCETSVCHVRRSCDWHDAEIYILLVFDIVYAYNSLMLLFGLCHCCSLVCGEALFFSCTAVTETYPSRPMCSFENHLSFEWCKLPADALISLLCSPDVTTKDIAAGDTLFQEPLCTGRRSLPKLLQSWRKVFCGPVQSKYAASAKLLPSSPV